MKYLIASLLMLPAFSYADMTCVSADQAVVLNVIDDLLTIAIANKTSAQFAQMDGGELGEGSWILQGTNLRGDTYKLGYRWDKLDEQGRPAVALGGITYVIGKEKQTQLPVTCRSLTLVK